MIYCLGSKHSCGNLILFNPALDVKVESCETDQKGRQIVLHAKIDDTSFIFANIYAPNEPKWQLKFFKCLKVRLRKYADENLIMGGDMNCCLSPEDKRGGRPTKQKKQVIESIHDLCNSFNLVDLRRKLHPNESHFTWQSNSSAIQCRLDYWLVSKQLLAQVKECSIIPIPVSFSDHSAVSFLVQSDDFIKRGPSFFLNSTIPFLMITCLWRG